MKRNRRLQAGVAVLVAWSWLAVTPPASASDTVVAGPSADGEVADGEALEPQRPAVQSLGSADQRLLVVDDDGRWSMHAENLATVELLRLWHEAGGPAFATKSTIDRPFTISVHALPPERILERVLDGYGYTLHYSSDGRLVLVRVYSPEGTQNFKTPRLVESAAHWREEEANAGTP